MKNNLDQDVREKLQERAIQPSASAWERLSSQLEDAQQKRKNKWFLYMGYAASVLLVASLVFFLQQQESTEVQNTLVQKEIKNPFKDEKNNIQNTIKDQDRTVIAEGVKTESLDAIDIKESNKVKNIETKDNNPKFSSLPPVLVKQQQIKESEIEVSLKKINELHLEENTQIASIDNDSAKINETKRISVDSEALLVSVTSSREEITAFYQKYKVNRAKVLATIQTELNRSNLKIDPNTILAEVEKDVNEENFQNNFYQFIKKRVSNVAIAIANRNN